MRYFVHISYQGTRYCGWQYQPNKLSVQEVLETSLSKLLKHTVVIFGCGRTDAGVHASQFYFHFDTEKEWNFDLFFRWNRILPDDIAVFDIIPVDGREHARYDAVQRTYDYFIHTYKDPFLSERSAFYLLPDMDLQEMKKAVMLLPAYNDYSAYCKSPDKNEHNICNISSAALFINASGNRIRFQISSNRFLGRMIRILSRKLIEIGTGTFSVDEFESHLITKRTPALILPAHPQGLYLTKVNYPFLNLPVKSDFNSASEKSRYWKEV